MEYFVGIDPGKSGAIAVINVNKTVIDIYDIPTLKYSKGKKNENKYDIYAISKVLRDISEFDGMITGYLEKMQSMPPGKMKIQATFSLAKCEGIFETAFTIYEMPYELVKPKQWQKHFGITSAKGDTKAQSFQIARQLFPESAPLLTGPKGGKKDGRCDALLLAEYGRRKSAGESNG